MHALILIERYSSSSIFWPNLLKAKKIYELSVEEIINKYQGFEGDLLLYFECTQHNQYRLHDIINENSKHQSDSKYVLLHVISGNKIMPINIENRPLFLGYDVGVCEEEKTIYSSIFNEILFGHIDELTTYKKFLNENLLFPNKDQAEMYVNLHNNLSAQGKSVEDYEPMTIYEIWKQNI